MRYQRSTGEALSDVVGGFVAGCIGGAVASWAMNRFQEYSSHPHVGQEQSDTPAAEQQQQQSHSTESGPPIARSGEGGEDATVKTATAISRRLFEHELSPGEKQLAGPAVHYAYGTLMGGLYGALAEVLPVVADGGGVLYGTALWVLGDEVAVPALGLSEAPTKYPASVHAASFATHVCYGVTLDIARRVAKVFI